MPLQLANNPDIALAQEWLAQLAVWIERYGLTGYDPFDVKAHPRIRACQHRPVIRKATTALCDMFPHTTRRLLHIPATLNPKALALVALAEMRLFQVTNDTVHLDKALARLEELEACACTDGAGPCWGYPFAVHATGLDTPANTPVTVVSAIAGEAFLLAHELTSESRFLDVAQGVALFMLEDLPRIDGGDNMWCFAYTPTDRRRVHNANLLAVEHITSTAARIANSRWCEEVAPALAFTVSRQRDDGAWSYGEFMSGDPYEPGLLGLVDHHHTGFVLRSLHAIDKAHPDTALKKVMKKGITFYKKLMRPSGMPVHEYAAWPVDIHACAEGILCPSVLADTMSGALARALLVMRWTHSNLRDTRTGAPWYRKYPGFKSRIVFPRWSVAWMFRALAEYLHAFQQNALT